MSLAELLQQDALTVAPQLLGAKLTSSFGGAGPVTVRLTEVEAYLGTSDPGSHAYNGPTPRTEIMFAEPGFIYVYFTDGIHSCANIICSPAGTASGVLLRAGEILDGVELARYRRLATKNDRDLASGPARLAQALGLDRKANGAKLFAADSMRLPAEALSLELAPLQSREEIASGLRIGVSGLGGGAAYPWRYWIDGNKTVSRYKAAVPGKIQDTAERCLIALIRYQPDGLVEPD
ncbi:DNA-3-methyladenine glycosylase II [Renibacterium salmoninarum ATCC 33209]|uniref:Putative 3-methyladenine DNA glycosylase n=1 Tax=Renibacterium salmoninarum (strain ATCC 33209 / DSM 20767 / JCM 11484 / NBRC 15589 / NCIMB 2235) TaxID=288705 RepID=A9WQH5_RENSM|nr:DNA-3-methyladenine glycosylase [Renibacterium salmoninarum]ABY22545.1 DNA-3-methyladenine glycosylase II [Renibacterium salmoninarum ATCC 33209]